MQGLPCALLLMPACSKDTGLTDRQARDVSAWLYTLR
jgi:hypothetical protein